MGKSTRPETRGPTVKETVFARKIEKFFEENPDLRDWVQDKIKTPAGQRELQLLVCAARQART